MADTNELAVEYVQIADLKPYASNARTHGAEQIAQIRRSMREFGFTNPLLIDEEREIIAGHGRLEAAKAEGMERVPCIVLAGLDDRRKRALRIADNRIALNAGWNEQLLVEELRIILDGEGVLEFETGFSIGEVDALLFESEPDPRDDEIPERIEPRCRKGDLWKLGRHMLICGDARSHEAMERLMGGEKARMAFTDPPYNVAIEGNVSDRHGDFAMASGEMSEAEFTGFLREALDNLIAHSLDGAIHFVCMDWRHLRELQDAATGYSEMKNLIVWVKDNGGMGTFYRSRHELIAAYKVGKGPHMNNFGLDRYRTNVWEYKGMNSFGAERAEALAMHPTVKPVAMIADAIIDVSDRGEIVLDPFGGSGSTLIAAEKTGRRARLMEIDPAYCDVIIARWERHAGGRGERVEEDLW